KYDEVFLFAFFHPPLQQELKLFPGLDEIEFCHRRPRAVGVAAQGDELYKFGIDWPGEFHRVQFFVFRKDAFCDGFAPVRTVIAGIKGKVFDPTVLISVLAWQRGESRKRLWDAELDHQFVRKIWSIAFPRSV